MKIETVPESIISQCKHVLNSKNYSSAYRREIVRLIVGSCATCGDIPNKYVIVTQAGAEVISRYCDKDFIKYQKYNNNKPKRKVKK